MWMGQQWEEERATRRWKDKETGEVNKQEQTQTLARAEQWKFHQLTHSQAFTGTMQAFLLKQISVETHQGQCQRAHTRPERGKMILNRSLEHFTNTQ